jgi:hypothetical protein
MSCLEAVIVGDGKGIFAGKIPARVFDLGTDPGEQADRAGADTTLTRALRKFLREHRRQSLELHRAYGSQREADDVILSERERERLRAFGYLE